MHTIISHFFLLIISTILISSNIFSEVNKKALITEQIIAGSKDKFMEVRHVVLKGTNYEIGKAIAQLAQKNHNINLTEVDNDHLLKAQRNYISANYPALFERMRGAANAYGRDLATDPFDISSLNYNLAPMGCSAVYYPQDFTEAGHGILSRNFDFSTGDIMGRRVKTSGTPVISRPYIFEVYPDNGYASIYLCAFDLMGGVLDGMNSEGLVLSILADNSSGNQPPYEPLMGPGVGLNELMIMRYLLDNCSNIEQAKESLLSLKQYYFLASLHYIVADRSGRSFVFEYSPSRNKSYIIDGSGPQCITNHLLYKYKSPDNSPAVQESWDRYSKLINATRKPKFSIDEIKQINQMVSGNKYSFLDQNWAPSRTLWHSIYDQNERTLEVKFYLGEKTDPQDPTRGIFEETEYYKFNLKQDKD